MATTTIHAETLGTPINTAEILYWDVENGYQRRAPLSSLIGATLTGNGVVATGGYSLTVPATGTAALLERAQTFTALQTLSAGLTFGQSTLDYYKEDTWTPTGWDTVATGGHQAGAASVVGFYRRIGKVVHVTGLAVDIDTTGMTAGNAFFLRGLPFPALSTTNFVGGGWFNFANVAFTGMVAPSVDFGTSAIKFLKSTTGAAVANIIVSNLTSGTADISFGLTYFTD